MKLYQTLTDWEEPSAPYRVRLYAWPRTLDPLVFRFIGLAPPAVPSRVVPPDPAAYFAPHASKIRPVPLSICGRGENVLF